MAREIGDLAALLGTMSGGAFGGIGPGNGGGAARPRIGWLGDWGGAFPMEPGILALAEAALARMEGRGLGGGAGGAAGVAGAAVGSWTDLRAFAVAQDLVEHWRDPETRAQLNPQAIYEIERGLALGEMRPGAALELRANGWRRLRGFSPPTTRWSCPPRSSGPSRRSGTGRARSRAWRWTPITAGWRWWSRRALRGCPRWACRRGWARAVCPVACN
jgi:hypothetical protein